MTSSERIRILKELFERDIAIDGEFRYGQCSEHVRDLAAKNAQTLAQWIALETRDDYNNGMLNDLGEDDARWETTLGS